MVFEDFSAGGTASTTRQANMALQVQLNKELAKAGEPLIAVDGIVGPQTRNAQVRVKEIQAEQSDTGGDTGGEASPLLATPGKRDRDFKWISPDKRKQDGRESSGPRNKAYRRIATPETMTGATTRSRSPGYSELSQLSKGIYTEQLSNYEEEEERIFSINYETQALIENLNNMEPKSDET